jgi:hypothetical protein
MVISRVLLEPEGIPHRNLLHGSLHHQCDSTIILVKYNIQVITYINGVYNPRETVSNRHLLVFGILFLSKECMVGIPLRNGRVNHGFDCNVGRTHQLLSAPTFLDSASSTIRKHSG